MEIVKRITHTEHPEISDAIKNVYGVGIEVFERNRPTDFKGLRLGERWNLQDTSKTFGPTRTIGLTLTKEETELAPGQVEDFIKGREEPRLSLEITPNATYFKLGVVVGAECALYYSNDLSGQNTTVEIPSWLKQVVDGRKKRRKKKVE